MIGLYLLLALAVTSFLWLPASTWLAWENRRFSRCRFGTPLNVRRKPPRALLVVPVKGGDADLESGLAGFFLQQHSDFELTFVVESAADPAIPVITRLRKKHPEVDVRTVVAGLAEEDGQKVHNLLVATRDIDPAIRILAFADADIRPDPDWLQLLCDTAVERKNATANTGYRWMLPDRYSLANLYVYSANAMLAGTLGVGSHYLIWGGSWAMRRNDFDRLDIREAWKGTLSDDLVATRTIKQRQQRIVYDPRCLCKSSFDLAAPAAVEFLRRQMLIGRKYAPQLFWGGLGIMLANVVTWWWLVWLAVSAAGEIAWLAVWGLLALYAGSVSKGVMRQSVFAMRDSITFRHYGGAAIFDILGWPLVATITLAIMLSATVGHTIVWRGNHYLIRRGGQIRLLRRSASPAVNAGPARQTNRNRAA